MEQKRDSRRTTWTNKTSKTSKAMKCVQAMSSCVSLHLAPDDYLGINPSMVHSLPNVVDPVRSKAACNSPNEAHLTIVPQVLHKRVRIPSPKHMKRNRIDSEEQDDRYSLSVASLQA
ncbi:hypothetical protein PIB30_060370 [Stylosanthes scabra]|uniref:Uncharacterized protein n=1 Tax=Stylosanthes scabra TaxID=79078 RepID=A0ABU6TLT6_9FABA|nr:hypothetical protein [Stylosanthes scabra]